MWPRFYRPGLSSTGTKRLPPRNTSGRTALLRTTFALAALFAATSVFARPPADSLANPPAGAKVWSITDPGGTRHGQVSLWTAPDGTRWSRMDFNLRGFISE